MLIGFYWKGILTKPNVQISKYNISSRGFIPLWKVAFLVDLYVLDIRSNNEQKYIKQLFTNSQ